jgi:Flp pilus assembly protein TadD
LEALYYLNKALKSKPNDVHLLNLGSTLQEMGNYTGTISLYKKVLALSPNHIGALVGIGVSLENLGNHSATEYYKEASAQPAKDSLSNEVILYTLIADFVVNGSLVLSLIVMSVSNKKQYR